MDDAEFIRVAATNLNKIIDIAWIGEATEQQLIESALSYVVPVLPVRIRDLLFDASNGLDDAEIREHADWIADEASSRLPIFVRIWAKSVIIVPLVSKLLSFARVGQAMAKPE